MPVILPYSAFATRENVRQNDVTVAKASVAQEVETEAGTGRSGLRRRGRAFRTTDNNQNRRSSGVNDEGLPRLPRRAKPIESDPPGDNSDDSDDSDADDQGGPGKPGKPPKRPNTNTPPIAPTPSPPNPPAAATTAELITPPPGVTLLNTLGTSDGASASAQPSGSDTSAPETTETSYSSYSSSKYSKVTFPASSTAQPLPVQTTQPSVGTSSTSLVGSSAAETAPSVAPTKSSTSSSNRNAAIAGGTIGAIAAIVLMVLIVFVWKRGGFASCFGRRTSRRPQISRPSLSRKASGASDSSFPRVAISAPVEVQLPPPRWNYHETFAEPSFPDPEPPTPRTRKFRGPLNLNPPTPTAVAAAFPSPKNLIPRSFFRASNASTQSFQGARQKNSILTQSSVALPLRYDRLPSPEPTEKSTEADDDNRRSGKFQSTYDPASAGLKSPPAAYQRYSQATNKTDDSEPARFRTVTSWVNYQSQRQLKANQVSSGTAVREPTTPAIPEGESLPKVPPKPGRKSTASTANTLFHEHPGTKVDLPSLKAKRIKSDVLDRNILGYGVPR